MGRDRFVRFDDKMPPGQGTLQLFLEDFVGEGGKVSPFKNQRAVVDLPGMATHPMTRIHPEWTTVKARLVEVEPRFIEIFCGEAYVDVITRHADPFTEAVADGVAQRIAQWFGGVVEDP